MTGFMKGLWVIATYTFREGMRKKTLIGFLILSILVIFGSNVMSAFVTESGIAAGDTSSDMDARLVKDICVTAISIFGVLITIFISASVVPTEVENKTIYTILSKPIRRFQYLLGKFVGVQLIVLLNLFLMGGLFFFALYFKQKIVPTLLLWSVLLTYFEFLIISAFTFAVSCASSSAVVPTIAGLFIYITGNLTVYLKDAADRASQYDAVWVGNIAKGLFNVLPNLQRFSLKSQILNMEPNDPPVDLMLPNLVLYGLLYAVTGFIMAYWVFRRKEL